MTLRQSGEFIGWCCTGIKDELPPPNRELVYAVVERFRNRGYATQAVSALVAYLFAETDASAVNAVALVGNAPSNRVIQKSGLPRVGLVQIEGEPYHHYRRMR
jgi:RimJ/RimL family protein N-acetyltransferase